MMTTGANRTRSLALVLAICGLVSAACGATTDELFDSKLQTVDQESATQDTAPEPTSDPNCNDADPRPSLRPAGPLPDPGQMPAGTTMAEIESRGVLRAGVAADTLLFGSLDPFTAQLEGFDVDLARLVAEAIFGTSSKIELIPIRSAERIERLQQGDVDIVIKTMTINCERWGQINFSSVYYESGQKLLVRVDSSAKAVDDLVDETICALPATTSLKRLQESGVATTEADSWTGCLALFQQGLADGISTDDTILAGLVSQDRYAKVVGDAFSSEPYGIGVAQQNIDLTRFVNAVLEQARTDGTWQELYDKWLADTLGPSGGPPKATYRD